MCLAIPGKVLETADSGWNRVAKVQFGGVTRQVYLDFVPEAGVGDYVLVHVGFAVGKVDEAEAKRTYQLGEERGGRKKETGFYGCLPSLRKTKGIRRRTVRSLRFWTRG